MSKKLSNPDPPNRNARPKPTPAPPPRNSARPVPPDNLKFCGWCGRFPEAGKCGTCAVLSFIFN